MIVSQDRAANQTSLLPFFGGADTPTPFWELEELIARGFTHETALALMAARRAGQDATIQSPDTHAPFIPQQPAGKDLLNESATALPTGH